MNESIFLVSTDAEALESPSCGPGQNLSNSSDQVQTVTLGNTLPTAAEMVPLDGPSPAQDNTVTQSEG